VPKKVEKKKILGISPNFENVPKNFEKYPNNFENFRKCAQ
jgi:hypothetical protein